MILRNPRVLLVCLGVIVAALAAASLRYFTQYQPLTALGGGLLSDAGQFALEANQVRVVGRSSGLVSWRMTAQTVTLSRDRRAVSVYGIRRGILYAAAGKPSVLLSADRAGYQTPFGSIGPGSIGSLQVSGHVVAHVLSAEHPSLKTEMVSWDSASSTLTCPVSLTAALPRLSVTAGNAAYTSPPGALTRGVMHLSRGVHAQIDSSRGILTLDCPGLTWTADGQTAQSLGPVTTQIPGGLGTATASDISVNTRTGDVLSHGLRGTLRVSQEVQ